jgi:hypothetical protein
MTVTAVMTQFYLPNDHTEADLVLAGQVAELVESSELYVAWTPELGQVVPEVAAVFLEPGPPSWVDTLALLIGAVSELVSALFSRRFADAAPLDPLSKPATGLAAHKPAAGEAA